MKHAFKIGEMVLYQFDHIGDEDSKDSLTLGIVLDVYPKSDPRYELCPDAPCGDYSAEYLAEPIYTVATLCFDGEDYYPHSIRVEGFSTWAESYELASLLEIKHKMKKIIKQHTKKCKACKSFIAWGESVCDSCGLKIKEVKQ